MCQSESKKLSIGINIEHCRAAGLFDVGTVNLIMFMKYYNNIIQMNAWYSNE